MTHYLIDTENIATNYDHIIAQLNPGDRMTLFYTDANATLAIPFHMLEEVTRQGAAMDAIHCGQGKNALDFQLVTYLGYLVATRTDDSFVVCSDDNGFAAAVEFWQNRGRTAYHMRTTSAIQEETSAKLPSYIDVLENKASDIDSDYDAEKNTKNDDTEDDRPVKHQTRCNPSMPAWRCSAAKCKSIYIGRLTQVGIRGETAERIAKVMLHTMNLPPKGKALQIQNQMKQVFGSKRGMQLYHQAKRVFTQVMRDGPYPY